eukprot:265922-Prymnesium_polylepis.1
MDEGDVPRLPGFNALVDLCGVFKKTSIHEVRALVLAHFGPDRFHYIYHIDQTNGGDRVLYLNSENDVQFDEEFYKFLCKSNGPRLREKIFFFIDNRNVIGKEYAAEPRTGGCRVHTPVGNPTTAEVNDRGS